MLAVCHPSVRALKFGDWAQQDVTFVPTICGVQHLWKVSAYYCECICEPLSHYSFALRLVPAPALCVELRNAATFDSIASVVDACGLDALQRLLRFPHLFFSPLQAQTAREVCNFMRKREAARGFACKLGAASDGMLSLHANPGCTAMTECDACAVLWLVLCFPFCNPTLSSKEEINCPRRQWEP